jgi:protein ImuB
MKTRCACLFLPRTLDERVVHALAEACHRFTPQVAVRGSEAVFLEIAGSRRLYPEGGLPARLNVLSHRFGIVPRVAFADDAPAALALARFNARSEDELPLQAMHDYASPFEEDPDARVRVDAAIQALRRLGLSRLRELLQLPVESFASRFGRDVSSVAVYLRHRPPIAWPRFMPEETIVEESDLRDPETLTACADLGAALFVLEGLMDRAVARLWARARKASTLALVMELDDRRKLKWRVHLPFAQSSARGMLRILQERLSFDFQRHPLSSPVARLELTIAETVASSNGQRDFFSQKEEKAEALDALLGVLSARLGQDRVFHAQPADRHLPEGSWTRQPRPGPARHLALVPSRPLRLLKRPEPLRISGDLLDCSSQGRSWEATGWQGPERITGEWWKDPELEGFSRDYYRVATRSGERLWVFESRGLFFLHGYFD